MDDEWYEHVAKSRPPKDEPWYQVMVDRQQHTTYVAQQNLEESLDLSPVEHPDIDDVFSDFQDGRYLLNHRSLQ